MIPFLLTRRQVLPCRPAEAFAFFDRPENLALITPPSLGFRIITPSPVGMKEGAVIDYTIRWLGLPVRWTTLITAYEPPFMFVDQQIRGPYSFWHHTHTFRAAGQGTEMTDEVRYLLPLGPIGNIAHAVIVKKQLEGIFEYRRHVIADTFGAPPPESERKS